ncbi:hypothetical protein BC941DRAFT_487985 [Chlamydoabsidia padenii]|nr:hypothetical protein BC941DRAFT_487985 [Chlamydoabsidia padenii]
MQHNSSLTRALERLTRIKYENMAFIGFQIWAMFMVLDATIQQNAAEVCVLANLYVLCAIFGGLQIMDCQRWINVLKYSTGDGGISIIPLHTAFTLEIILTVLLGLFSLTFGVLSYKISREFGWMIYKKIGADQAVKQMYTIFQYFVLCLKIDVFVEFLVSCFYLIQFVINSGQMDWHSWVFLFVTVLMLPMLYFARLAVSRESVVQIIVFIVFQFVVLFEFVLVLIQTLSDGWYIWICFVTLGILFALVTCILAATCMHNFCRGLYPYVQRGGNDKNTNQDQLHLNKKDSIISWHIDEE